ncbi:gliding motility lipoprotein GldD [Ulvibacter litoralis]|uniref:Gliding motility-associated lipoprotein GldD n=1 Tax=Ulvibacter litoralis TaxID=227084 RepID=A0A1G7CU72_9FLAO|nr:gliding motility lipoprotein GldD [Ulvibacter litoralis]GHC46010.1 gliding motility lipoprotein GldD [Ulvibacter litoralis]SDE42912.1 gliding motility-associated lipoprotein GldD [Ulvibacter litoralis]
MFRLFFITLFCVLLVACNDDVLVKPNAMLRLEYPKATYKGIATNCPYSFEINEEAVLKSNANCAFNVSYPKMNATIYLTYQDVAHNNLDSLLYDAQKLAYDHNIKAESIPEQPFVNTDEKVYGMFYMINGNAASQSHFYVTDSVNHFVSGSLYFEAKPNFDSIYPAVVYLRNDIRHVMETFTWEK